MTGRSGAERHESDERAMLRASVRALVSRYGGPRTAATSRAAAWEEIHSRIGGATVTIPERFGGGGGYAADMVVVLEELGAGLVSSPLLGTAVASAALTAHADREACGSLLSRLVDTGCAATVVFDPTAAVDIAEADIVLGIDNGRLVEYDISTITVLPSETMDSTRSIGSVDLSSAVSNDLGAGDHALSIARLYAAAEQVGAARRCLDLTVEYTTHRVQFGRPVGSFQALKHRMADRYVEIEAARALVHDAASTLSITDGRCDPGAVAAASVHSSEAFSDAAAEAVQMHGGIGVTWEYDISWYFKRAHGSRYLFGTPRDRMAALTAAAGL